jgi:SAM-dependent methyltransferase
MPCKYQRIVRGSKQIQPGDIDTIAKFRQLTKGIELAGKSLLDVGCNCGEMCRLAMEMGALTTLGIDSHRDYILQARKLNPELKFTVSDAGRAKGRFDVVLASALLHYIRDYYGFFSRMARVTKEILVLDAWLSDHWESVFTATKRGLFIPSEAALREIAEKWFGVIEHRGPALSPDGSKRFIFHLREPKPKSQRALLIYGPGGSGKTTLATEMLDYEHLQLDTIFIAWRRGVQPSTHMSVSGFVDETWRRGEVEAYLRFHEEYLRRWLGRKQTMDIVIEGYDMVYVDYRSMVQQILRESGWPDVEEIELPRRDAH